MNTQPAARQHGGFTLVELLTTIAITIVLAAAIPGVISLVDSYRTSNAGYELLNAFSIARSEAVKRNTDVTITPVVIDPDGAAWKNGWNITLTDTGEEIGVHKPLTRVVVATDADGNEDAVAIRYTRDGRLFAAATPLEIDTASTASFLHCLTIGPTGRPRMVRGECTW